MFGSWDEVGWDISILFSLMFGCKSRWDRSIPLAYIRLIFGTTLPTQKEQTDSSHLRYDDPEPTLGNAAPRDSASRKMTTSSRRGWACVEARSSLLCFSNESSSRFSLLEITSEPELLASQTS